MATTYKVLGQTAAAASVVNTLLYSVPNTKSAVASTLTVCNRASTTATYSIYVKTNTGSAALQAPDASGKEYIVFQASIPANTTTSYTLGLTLENYAQIDVSASATTVAFNLFGTEIS